MATIIPTKTAIEELRDTGTLVIWTPLTEVDSGQVFKLPGSIDRCVQVEGNFGTGGTARIEGSNVPIPQVNSDFTVLTDPQGNPLDLTTSRIEQIIETPLWIRPRIVAGTSVSLTVRLFSRRP